MEVFVEDQVWIKSYPVRYFGCRLNARMTVLSLGGGRLAVHSPCEIDAATRNDILSLGKVICIIAPGTYHWQHVQSAQASFPDAQTFVCPGIERKRPGLSFDEILSNSPPPPWAGLMEQKIVRGTRLMREVAFLHRPSRTLILTDLVENVTDRTPDTNLVLRFWFKVVFGMWNKPKPAPEYQLGWKDKEAAAASLSVMLDWPFDRVIVAHGDNILSDAKRVLERAWAVPLAASPTKRLS